MTFVVEELSGGFTWPWEPEPMVWYSALHWKGFGASASSLESLNQRLSKDGLIGVVKVAVNHDGSFTVEKIQ